MSASHTSLPLSSSPTSVPVHAPAQPPPRPSTPTSTRQKVVDNTFATPRSAKASSTLQGSIGHSVTGEAYKSNLYAEKVTKEMDELIRQIDVSTFFRKYVPKIARGDLSPEKLESLGRDAERLKQASNEFDLYSPLCGMFNAIIEGQGTPYKFMDVSQYPESKDIDHKPDLGMYETDPDSSLAYTLDAQTHKTKQPRPIKAARVAWAWLKTVVEVKYHYRLCGYGMGEPTHDKLFHATPDGCKARVQNIKFANEILYRQHRTHLFTIYIYRTKARLFRWDRAGVIVTKPFDFVNEPEHLFNFVHRFAGMTPAEQGYDTTVQLASDIEVAEMIGCPNLNADSQKLLQEATEKLRFYPVCKIKCPVVVAGEQNNRDPSQVEILIGKAHTRSCSPTGRSTRGYIGYQMGSESERRLVFVKDTWRADSDAIRRELDTYARLKAEHVANIAQAIAGGDVGEPELQCTLSQDEMTDRGDTAPLKRIHTRLVLDRIGRPLESFEFSDELILVVFSAFIAHRDAYEKAGVLHRDISAANILIDITSEPRSPQGFLSDWDLAQHKGDKHRSPTQPAGRSGTWQYMSAFALQYPLKPIEVADDIESFLYVLVRFGLRFHAHSLSPKINTGDLVETNSQNLGLLRFIDNFFDDIEFDAEGNAIGGSRKREIIDTPKNLFTFKRTRDGIVLPLSTLITSFYDLVHEHYQAIRWDDYAKFKVEPPEEFPVVASTNIPNLDLHAFSRSWDQDIEDDGAVTPVKDDTVVTQRNPRLVLGTHAEVMKIFIRTLFTQDPLSKKRVPRKSTPICKTKDQFFGLMETITLHPKSASLTPSGSGAVKRKVLQTSLSVGSGSKKARIAGQSASREPSETAAE